MNIEKISTPHGNGQTGFWRNRGAFDCYVNGHNIGCAPTPDAAQALIDSVAKALAEA